MTPENFSKILLKKSAELKQFLQNNLPHYVGKTAVDFFRENFRQGGWRHWGQRRNSSLNNLTSGVLRPVFFERLV